MGIGPVEYMVVAFPGNKFKGEIIPATHFTKLRDAGLVESDGSSGLRGYSKAKLTDAGRAALS